MFSRLVVAVALMLASVGGALAQRTPVPTTHPKTQLNFAPTLGGAQFEGASSYPIGRDTAYSYRYAANKMLISVEVYDGGRLVAAGSDNPTVQNHFAEVLRETDRALKTSGYGGATRPSVPSVCTYGTLSFRCVVYSASAPTGRLFSKVMLTGYRDHFLKIKIDWSQGNNQTVADADKTLQAFIAALIH